MFVVFERIWGKDNSHPQFFLFKLPETKHIWGHHAVERFIQQKNSINPY